MYDKILENIKIQELGTELPIYDMLAKKVSYPCWITFLIRLYKSFDNLFPRFVSIKFKKEVQLVFYIKSDRNFKMLYEKFRVIKNNSSLKKTISEYLWLGKRRFPKSN